MTDGALFVCNSVLLGLGLAMDAFSVSMADGLGEPKMKTAKMSGIAGVFAFFQALMPMIGWVCVYSMARAFRAFEPFIPWIALLLLGYIGGKMLVEGLRNGECSHASVAKRNGFATILVQGIATSIDALAVGFTIAEYTWLPALFCALLIAAVTFPVCFVGIEIGKRFGVKLAGKASVLGGVILILIGVEIFLKGILF